MSRARLTTFLVGLSLVLGATTASAAPVPRVSLQTSDGSPSDDSSTWRGHDLVGPSDEEFDKARDEIDEIDEQIDQAKEEMAAIEQELAQAQEQLAAAADDLAAAEEVADLATQAADDARAEVERVQGDLEEAEAQREDNRQQLSGFARSAYMHGPAAVDPLLIMVEGLNRDESGGASDAQAAVDAVVRDRSKVLEEASTLVAKTIALHEEVAALQQARADKEAEALAAQEEAAVQHANMMTMLSEIEAKEARHRQLLDGFDQDRQEAVANLDDLEAKAAEARKAAEAKREYEAEQQRKAEEARKAAEQAAAAEKAKKEREAQAAEAAAAKAGQEADAADQVADTAERERDAANQVSVRHNGNLATVGGITVSASIADQLAALLADARADGIVLGGSGYRSPQVTVRLRMANGCPDVYTSPSSSCRVPTARPGSSMHEQGLAIDFSYHGATICFPRSPRNCHGNAGFNWLNANAHRYGFQGLSTEAWHFSTNGR